MTKLTRQLLVVAIALSLAPILVAACKRSDIARCEALWSTAHDQMSQVVAKHTTCARDDDCELVRHPHGCSEACDTAIARSGRVEYDATKARLEGAECRDWKAGGCFQLTPKPTPSCAMLTARCRDARCTLVNERL